MRIWLSWEFKIYLLYISGLPSEGAKSLVTIGQISINVLSSLNVSILDTTPRGDKKKNMPPMSKRPLLSTPSGLSYKDPRHPVMSRKERT